MRISADSRLLRRFVAFRKDYPDALHNITPDDPGWSTAVAASTIIDATVEAAFAAHGLDPMARKLAYTQGKSRRALPWQVIYVPEETSLRATDNIRRSLGSAMVAAAAGIRDVRDNSPYIAASLPPAEETLFVVPAGQRDISVPPTLIQGLRVLQQTDVTLSIRA